MQGWLEPIGPQPPRTYWVRRAVILVIVVALVSSVGWLLSRPRPVTAVAASSESTSQSSSPTTSESTPTASATDAVSTSPNASSETDSPAASAQTPAASVETPTPTAAPTPPCRPQALTVRVTGPDSVALAGPATFTLLVSTTQQNCVLDLATTPAALVLTSGSDHIWATSDCPEWQPAGSLTLAAGQETGIEVGWPVRRANGCGLAETTLGAGTYVATATVGAGSGRFVLQLRG